MDSLSTDDFDLRALADALDEQRVARGLSWPGVIREMIGSKEHQRRQLSASTVKSVGSGAVAEADGVLQMLSWLKRSPESFITEYHEPADAQLPEVPKGKILRFDTRKLFCALEAERIDHAMTWEQVASETRCGASGLKPLSQGGRTVFPAVMRLTRWLDQPAANFVGVADRGRLPPWRTR